MKLNLGCGYSKLVGYVNVDHDAICNPDMQLDLNQPLPFEDNSVTEIRLQHVLEHLGQDAKTYFAIWKEFYRVLSDGGEIKIVVPHWQHENFHHDPTHVRKVTPIGVKMFDQARNMNTIAAGGAETTLGLQLGIDFEVSNVKYDLTPDFQREMQLAGKTAVTEYDINKVNNSCHQIFIDAVAHKPPRSANK